MKNTGIGIDYYKTCHNNADKISTW